MCLFIHYFRRSSDDSAIDCFTEVLCIPYKLMCSILLRFSFPLRFASLEIAFFINLLPGIIDEADLFLPLEFN